MRLFVKFVICVAIELACIFAGLIIGGWLPIRNVPAGQLWAGDGIGIMLFGLIGAIIGAIVGGFGILLFLLRMRRTARPQVQPITFSSEEVWPPPPSIQPPNNYCT